MGLGDSVRWAIDVAGILASGFEIIAGITKTTTDDKIVAGFHAIRGVVGSVERGITGKVSMEICRKELAVFHLGQASNDDEADARLRRRMADTIDEPPPLPPVPSPGEEG